MHALRAFNDRRKNAKAASTHAALAGGNAAAVSVHKAKRDVYDKGPTGFETTGRGANWEETPAQKTATSDAVAKVNW